MTDFALNYHSPLDRIRLKAASLGVKVSTSEVVGAILQAMKISPDFKIKMKASLLEEMKVVDNVFRKCYAASSVKVCTDSLFVDKLGMFLLNAFYDIIYVLFFKSLYCNLEPDNCTLMIGCPIPRF